MSSRYQSKSRSLYHTDIPGLAIDDEAPVTPPTIAKHTKNSASNGSSINNIDPEIYPFNRDAMASVRLNLQHQVWITSTGYLLHPSIPLPINPLIADIACGTGIWSLSLSSQLPTGGRIEAFDLSLAQTPPKAWTPHNLSFRQLDILSDVPADLMGKFDIVNIRLFMCVIASGDPMPFLHNLMKLLKPGGYLQWQEYDPTAERFLFASPSASAPKLSALYDAARAGIPPMKWIATMASRFPEAGGELVQSEKVWTKQECYGIKQDLAFLAVREWAANMRSKGNAKKAEEIEAMCGEAEEETQASRRGCVIDSEIITWVVKKV